MSRMRMTPDLVNRIKARIRQGGTSRRIASEFGVSTTTIRNVDHGHYDDRDLTYETSGERAARVLADWKTVGPEPTPEEIAEACRLLRAGRTDADAVWTVPELRPMASRL